MIDLVASKHAEIKALCEQYEVKRLALFGSAAKGTWCEGTSDLDFLIDLGDYGDCVAKRLMGFLAGLERLFGEDFDAVTERSIHSATFRDEVNQSAITLYEQPDRQQVA